MLINRTYSPLHSDRSKGTPQEGPFEVRPSHKRSTIDVKPSEAVPKGTSRLPRLRIWHQATHSYLPTLNQQLHIGG